MNDVAGVDAQIEALKKFYVEGLRTLADRPFVHAKSLIPDQTIFTLKDFQRHLSNPLLQRANFTVFHLGKPVDYAAHAYFKMVQGTKCHFLDRRPLDELLGRGAACLLEGIDMLDPLLNRLAADIDRLNPNLIMSNIVVFFSQKGNEAYRGHFDTDDVLVLHIEGKKRWHLYERQPMRWVDKNELPPERLGKKTDELVMEAGDALLVKNGVPHVCETLSDMSLHMSFDLCDRAVHPGRLAELLLQRYERDACYAYSSPEEKLKKFLDQGTNPEFQTAIRAELAAYRRELQSFREKMGASEVHFFDRWLNRS
ncbi:MAG: hypothetical protein FJY54_07145 [Betaproteobacteria bacterium]|nr:hypothetical protein [Betaproteobacteria bacterium]